MAELSCFFSRAVNVAIPPVRPFSDTGRRQISLDLGRIMLGV
jgi:hypothetical protein